MSTTEDVRSVADEWNEQTGGEAGLLIIEGSDMAINVKLVSDADGNIGVIHVGNYHSAAEALSALNLFAFAYQCGRNVATSPAPEENLDSSISYGNAFRLQWADLLTPAEAAALSGKSESGWRNRCAAGQVPGAAKKGKQWLIPAEAVSGEKPTTPHAPTGSP